MTFDEYINHPDCQDSKKIEGFTIGKRGKKIFWYFYPTVRGYYRIVSIDNDGFLTEVRSIISQTEVQIVYKKE